MRGKWGQRVIDGERNRKTQHTNGEYPTKPRQTDKNLTFPWNRLYYEHLYPTQSVPRAGSDPQRGGNQIAPAISELACASPPCSCISHYQA